MHAAGGVSIRMAKRDQLRELRTGTVINLSSKQMESKLGRALQRVADDLQKNEGVRLKHEKEWKLKDIVRVLRAHFSSVAFHYYFDTSSLKPDGGILSVLSTSDIAYPILISEVKRQGTNDLRAQEGKRKQAKGNAIERLGKNVIGFRAAMRHELIFPFVCFGEGVDFADDSSILDRVSTIALFSKLRTVNLMNDGPEGVFNRGTFYFREQPWTEEEMYNLLRDISRRAVQYYFAKYGEKTFRL